MTQKQIIELPFAPGIYTEETDRGASGRWKSGDKVRFRKGLPEKIGGWEQLAPMFLGTARNMIDWASLDGTLWTAIGTDWKLYLWRNTLGGQLYDITPIRREVALTDPFTTVSGSALVTVVDPGHGCRVNDFMTFSGATAVGGLDMNGEFQVAAVVNINTYTVTAVAAAGSSASGGGAVSAVYQINTGPVSTGFGRGWGTGTWNQPGTTWGTARPGSSFVVGARTWSLDNWGEDLIASPFGGSIYWWRRINGPSVRAFKIDQAPERTNYTLISQRDRQLFALGAVERFSDVFDPLLIRWCAQEDLEDWVPVPANTSGDIRLFSGSRIVTGKKTRGEILVFTDTTVHSLVQLGPGNYGTNVVGENVSILGPNAAVAVDHRVMFMAEGDFYLYDGVLRVLPCDVRNFVYERIDFTQREKVFAGLNREFNEIWWFYPVADSVPPAPPPFEFTANDIVILASGIDDTQFPNTNVEIHDIAYGNGRYVAVATQGKLTTSVDGLTWVEEPNLSVSNLALSSVVFGAGLFVVTGQAGFMATSPDGINWTVRPTITDLGYANLHFYEGEFLGGNAGGRAYRSSDGINWSFVQTPSANAVWNVAKGNGVYVVAVSDGLYTSSDFISWTLTLSATITSLIWDEFGQRFIAAGASIHVSSDGAVGNWQTLGSGVGTIAASPNGFYVAALPSSGAGNIRYSTDLLSWSVFNGTYELWNNARFLVDRFYAVGNQEQLVHIGENVYVENVVIPPSEITDYVTVNYEEGTWSTGKVVRTAWADRSPVLNKPYAASTDGYLYQHETGTDDNGQPMVANLKSYDMEVAMGEDLVHVDQLIPDFLVLEGGVEVLLRGRKYPQEPSQITKGPYPVIPGTRKISTRIRARQVSLEINSDQLGDHWRMGRWRARAGVHGKRG